MSAALEPIVIQLPDFHTDQIKCWDHFQGSKRNAIRCGRRWGKTLFGGSIASDAAAKGEYVGWFAPSYKLVAEAYREIEACLLPIKRRASKDGVFSTTTGGRVDFWSLDNEMAGRSRKYHKVIIDEGAFTKPRIMLEIWERAIEPTLLDFDGDCWVLSNTNGVDPENFLYAICNDKKYGFREFHAPTRSNPLMPLPKKGEPPEEYMRRREETFAKLRAERHPLVYRQEYEAEFVDWSGVAFFALDKWLDQGNPTDPPRLDAVYAIVDSAAKTGTENDGTAVIYFGLVRGGGFGRRLFILDWDIEQIEGALLETWLPNVFKHLEALASQYKARFGSLGSLIEDKSTGTVLIQQAKRRNWPAKAIDSKLTSLGKDERAISVSGYHYRGEVGITTHAYNKTKKYKGSERNHLVSQVTGFRVGDKDAGTRADDLLDTYCYGVACGLGDYQGW